jgi:hypothetical protein
MAPVGAADDVVDEVAGCVLPLQATMITTKASNTDNETSFLITAPKLT